VYAVALHSAGRLPDATMVLKDNLARHPNDRDTLWALVSFSREAGDSKSALEYAERLLRLLPDDPRLARLMEELRSQITKNQLQ